MERLIISNQVAHYIVQTIRLQTKPEERHEIELTLLKLARQNKGLKWRFEKVLIETS